MEDKYFGNNNALQSTDGPQYPLTKFIKVAQEKNQTAGQQRVVRSMSRKVRQNGFSPSPSEKLEKPEKQTFLCLNQMESL
jgi:hypothetical protein